MSNDFSQLSAESAESHFAQMTPEEHAEYQAYLDAQNARLDLECADDPRDSEPVTTPDDDAAYDGGGWPGDGSGTDDLADLMAHGDEGCCDGPGD